MCCCSIYRQIYACELNVKTDLASRSIAWAGRLISYIHCAIVDANLVVEVYIHIFSWARGATLIYWLAVNHSRTICLLRALKRFNVFLFMHMHVDSVRLNCCSLNFLGCVFFGVRFLAYFYLRDSPICARVILLPNFSALAWFYSLISVLLNLIS